jgi:hypothetical protein
MKKDRRLVGCLVFAAIIAAACAGKHVTKASLFPGIQSDAWFMGREFDTAKASIKLVPPKEFPRAPEDMRVFAVSALKLDEQWLTRLAVDKLGSSEPFTRRGSESCFGLENGEWQLIAHTDSGVHTMKNLVPSTEGEYPSPEETVKIAERFIAKLGYGGIANRFTKVVDNTSSYGMSLCAYCTIDGLEPRGNHMRIYVHVGKGGEITYASVQMPEFKAVGSFNIITPQEAYAKLIEGRGRFLRGCRGTVESVELVYLRPKAAQDYLVPIYEFAIKPEDGGDYPHLGVVDALPDKHLREVEKAEGEAVDTDN